METKITDEMNLYPELVKLHLHAKNDVDALQQIGELLLHENKVKDSYIPAVLRREEEYPTGLLCDGIGLAIPHTDAEHVKEQTIAIGVLDKPVKFKHMGYSGLSVEVSLVFMMAIKDVHKQVAFLQALMSAFQNTQQLKKMLNRKTQKEVIEIFVSTLENK
ncbi:MAG: PTS sugar transporter subunit IIA [Breznakia sp.]